MKRFALLFVIVIFSAVAVFAEMSVGVAGDIEFYNNSQTLEYSQYKGTTATHYTRLKGGLFLDLKYVEIGVDYLTLLSGEETYSGDVSGTDADIDYKLNYITFHGYGKYPFPINNGNAFVMLGAEYVHNLEALDSDGNDMTSSMTSKQKDNLNEIWIKAGGGVDLDIATNMYLRLTGLIGYKFKTEIEKDIEDINKDFYGWDSADFLGLALDLGVGLGFKL